MATVRTRQWEAPRGNQSVTSGALCACVHFDRLGGGAIGVAASDCGEVAEA